MTLSSIYILTIFVVAKYSVSQLLVNGTYWQLKGEHSHTYKFLIVITNVSVNDCDNYKWQGTDSQNFLGKFVRYLVILGLKILRLFRLKVLFEANIIKGWC